MAEEFLVSLKADGERDRGSVYLGRVEEPYHRLLPNAPRVVKQAVQKEGQEWRPTGDATDEPAPQGAPGRGRRLGGSKQEGGGRAEPPKNRRKRSGKNRGAVKTAER